MYAAKEDGRNQVRATRPPTTAIEAARAALAKR